MTTEQKIQSKRDIILNHRLCKAVQWAEKHGGMTDSESLAHHLGIGVLAAQRILGQLCDEGRMFYAGPETGIYHIGKLIGTEIT